MAAILIDARARFTVAKAAAIAKRVVSGEGFAPVDVEFLEAELRACMLTGEGFDGEASSAYYAPLKAVRTDDDGRPIEL